MIMAGCLSIFIGTHLLAEDATPKQIVSLAPSYDETLIEFLKEKNAGNYCHTSKRSQGCCSRGHGTGPSIAGSQATNAMDYGTARWICANVFY